MSKAKMVGCGVLVAAALTSVATADVSKYDDLTEGTLGTATTYQGVSYRDVNNVDGVFPDGSTFVAADLGNQLIIEDATFFYGDHPTWGSSPNALTFGQAWVPGPNLSIGALSTVWMDLATAANSASMDIAFYENGPWGGIVFRLDALSGGTVVASDTYTLSDLGGRDNIATRTLSVSAASFDSLHLYATFGSDYSAPRLMLDNLTLTSVPAPATAMLSLVGLAGLRRKR